jgi:hypothetical protein
MMVITAALIEALQQQQQNGGTCQCPPQQPQPQPATGPEQPAGVSV